MSDPRVATAVRVAAGTGDYSVLVGRGLLRHLPELLAERAPAVSRWAVISDATVAGLYGEDLARRLGEEGRGAGLHTFPAGEEHKNRGSWAGLTDALVEAGLGRDGGVVAMGGGVTGDLAGFVAATFMRGIPVVQVPTSVVAMVDSSVGGKTGVDTPAGKNLVGAFHAPALVVADPEVVETLPRAERAQGWVEAVKHGAILDEAYLAALEAGVGELLDGEPAAVEAAVVRSVELKADVVGRDEREGGLREILNFGHTLGHAVEAESGYRLPHGSAVSVGMVLEAALGEALGVTLRGTRGRLEAVLEGLGLPVAPPADLRREGVLARLAVDKKARGGRARFVLLERPGSVAADPDWARAVPRRALEGVLAEAFREGSPQAQ